MLELVEDYGVGRKGRRMNGSRRGTDCKPSANLGFHST